MIFKKELKISEIYPHTITTDGMPDWTDMPEELKNKNITIGQDTLTFDMAPKDTPFNEWTGRAFPLVGGLAATGFTLWLFFLGSKGEEHWSNFLIVLPLAIFLFIAGAIMLVKGIFYPDRKFIFNRTDGTISMPNGYMNLKNKTVTVRFEYTKFYYNPLHGVAGSMSRILIKGPYTYGAGWLDNAISARVMHMYNTQDKPFDLEWRYRSLFTWFMDKNRPLPPGTIFDPYRMADYERRKYEGFPPPLYPAKVPTPDIVASEPTRKKKK